jgi:hypothetical protein
MNFYVSLFTLVILKICLKSIITTDLNHNHSAFHKEQIIFQ